MIDTERQLEWVREESRWNLEEVNALAEIATMADGSGMNNDYCSMSGVSALTSYLLLPRFKK